MHHSKIDNFIEKISNNLKEHSIFINKIIPMQYGKKLTLEKNSETGTVVIYWSKKKGFSFVYEGSFDFEHEVKSILTGQPVIFEKQKLKQPVCYVGMDESGKGDYFGPLVASGFYVDTEIKRKLIEMGIADCKKLTNKRVIDLYNELVKKFPNNIKYRILMPKQYNEKYNEFSRKNHKLNALLGYLYSEIINEYIEQGFSVEQFLVDQFGKRDFVTRWLNNNAEKVEMRVRAESDVAVAAASIISRALFLNKINELSEKAGIDIPLGAGEKVDKTARMILNEFGEDKISRYVKLHFKNTGKIKGDKK